MEKSVERTQRTYIKLALGIPIGFVVFVFLLWGGCRSYKHLESWHQVRRAKGYLAGSNYRDASLSAQRSYQLEPNAGALRILAETAERLQDRRALPLRREALKLAPGSAEDILALASCALQFSETAEAERVLAGLSEQQKDSAGYFAVKARIAEAANDNAEAQRYWSKAVEGEPANNQYVFGLGLVRLKSDDPAVREAGRVVVMKLQQDPAQRAIATRALIADAIRENGDVEKIKQLGQQLQSLPEATISDRLMYLEILRAKGDPDFSAYLTKMENDCADHPFDLANLISWMNRNRLSILALDFARGIAAENLQKWPVPPALAESYTNVADWAGLDRLIKDAFWDKYEFLRHAYLARSARSNRKDVVAEREWAEAQKGASTDPNDLWTLTKLVSDWGWKEETVDLLWSLAKFPEKQGEALRTLYTRYSNAGDTQGLYRVLVRLFEIDPSDLNIQNNLAQVSLLLRADVPRARKLAADLYQKDPANAVYATTYAYSFFANGDTARALKILGSLRDDQLRDPSVAAYYGLMLAGAGEKSKARQYLEAGQRARLLPEEKVLMEKALTR